MYTPVGKCVIHWTLIITSDDECYRFRAQQVISLETTDDDYKTFSKSAKMFGRRNIQRYDIKDEFVSLHRKTVLEKIYINHWKFRYE